MDSQEGPISATHDYLFLVPGCPPMRPELGFIKFVSSLSPLNSLSVCFLGFL
jgi:hypothetical protein